MYVSGIVNNGRITSELGTFSLGQSVGVLPAVEFRLVCANGFSIKAYLNARGLSDSGKSARLLSDLLSFGVDLAAIKKTHFVCEQAKVSVLSSEYVVYLAYGDQRAEGVSLLFIRTLGARVDLDHVDAGGGGGTFDRGLYCPEQQFVLDRC